MERYPAKHRGTLRGKARVALAPVPRRCQVILLASIHPGLRKKQAKEFFLEPVWEDLAFVRKAMAGMRAAPDGERTCLIQSLLH